MFEVIHSASIQVLFALLCNVLVAAFLIDGCFSTTRLDC